MGMAKATSSPSILTITVTKALAAAANYDAEDVLSESAGTGTAWTFAQAARSNGGSGAILAVYDIFQTTNLTPRLTVYWYKATPTCVLNDNVANTSVKNADKANYLGRTDISTMEDLGGISESIATPSTVGNLPLVFTCASDADDIIGVVVTRDGFSDEIATDELSIVIVVEQY